MSNTVEVVVQTTDHMIDGVISREYWTIATKETAPVLRLYAGDYRIRVGDCVRMRGEHFNKPGTVLRVNKPI